VSTTTGWTLGTEACSSGQCLALLRTIDRGRTWSEQPLPSSIVDQADKKVIGGIAASHSIFGGLNVRFANMEDGWIYGSLAVPATPPPTGVTNEPVLWSTHDGGVSWHEQPLGWIGGEGTVFDLEASDGTVHLMAPNKSTGVTVESSPVGKDGWHVSNTSHLGDPAGGGAQTGSIVLSGANGWLIEGNDRGTTGSARLSGGKWIEWTPPCASVGGSFSVPAASSPSDLVAGCTMGGFAAPLSKSAPPGATLGSFWLYFSVDAGATFTAGPELRPVKTFYEYGGLLASPVPTTILMGSGTYRGQLIASFDGGTRFAVVYRADPFYVGFTTTSQGVGLVQAPNGATSEIMTFNGGRHWAKVSF
jgi:hypothetical protein